jgi:hypothetical protein
MSLEYEIKHLLQKYYIVNKMNKKNYSTPLHVRVQRRFVMGVKKSSYNRAYNIFCVKSKIS